MLDIKSLAIVLLIGRLFSMVFITLVLRKQYKLLRLPVEPPSKELSNFRILFFVLSCVVLVGNLAPVVIDILTLFIDTQRPATLHTISIIYTVSTSLTAAVSAFTIWLLYRTALSKDHNNN